MVARNAAPVPPTPTDSKGSIPSESVGERPRLAQGEVCQLGELVCLCRRAGLFGWISIGVLVASMIFQAVWFYAMGGMEMYQEMLQNMMQK